jgi:hypothetical protein
MRAHRQIRPSGSYYREFVEFSRDLRDRVASGEITVSFRLWRRAHAKVGSTYSVGSAQIAVDSIELMLFRALTSEDLRRSGEIDRESLRLRAAHAGPIADDKLLYRVEFHVVDEIWSSDGDQ